MSLRAADRSLPVTIRPAGSGTDDDVPPVAFELTKFPESELQVLFNAGVGFRVCREAVTDCRPDLLTQSPRGWPPGVNWSVVPGCYAPDEKNVIIATIAGPKGNRVVPPKGFKHGSWNLVLHETMHADDYSAGMLRCHNEAFLAARQHDQAGLSAYEAQEGQAGFEETYAESAAQFFGDDPTLENQLPALAEFWRSAQLPVRPGNPVTSRQIMPDTPIGTLFESKGDVYLDLRADGPNGIIGHALVRMPKGSAAHMKILENRRDSAVRGQILIRPF